MKFHKRDDLDYWYDDDCPVCQLMRKMEEENRSPTLNEMHEVFKKPKKKERGQEEDCLRKI